MNDTLSDTLVDRFRTIFEQSPTSTQIFAPDGAMVDANRAWETLWGVSTTQLQGYNILEDEQLAARGVMPLVRRAFEGETVHIPAIRYEPELTRPGVSAVPYRHVRAFLYPVKDPAGTILEVVMMHEDVTERVQAEERLREHQSRTYEMLEGRVEERTRELSILLGISRAVASTLQLHPLLGQILDQLKLVADYDGAGIVVLEGGLLRVIGYRGPIPQEFAMQVRFPAEGALVWELLKRREPVIIGDVRGDTPLAEAWREAVGDQLDTTYAFIRSWMAVPLTLKDEVIGGLTLESSAVDAYTSHHADFAVAIAQQAAVAIENARLYERAQEVAVLEERQRLSRELHDSVSQALYSIVLGAKTARALLDRDPAQAAQSLDFALAQAERGLAEMRALIFELRPESLEQEGLAGGLLRQATAWSARHGTPVTTVMCEEPDAPIPVKEALYRIAQEALQNIARHAHASEVRVSLSQRGSEIVLEVSDNGRGFDPSQPYPGHLGLHSMRERAARLGGTLQTESAPGNGTMVRASIPHGIGH